MDDTPEYVKKLQLEICLQKTPSERLRITLEDNDALFKMWAELRKNYLQNKTRLMNSKSPESTEKK